MGSYQQPTHKPGEQLKFIVSECEAMAKVGRSLAYEPVGHGSTIGGKSDEDLTTIVWVSLCRDQALLLQRADEDRNVGARDLQCLDDLALWYWPVVRPKHGKDLPSAGR